MLEQQGLLLGPWQLAQGPAGNTKVAPGRMRDVFDLAGGPRLGFVRGKGGKGWLLFRWLAPRVLEVYETEDASLLCTVRRPWGLAWGWEVLDAEGRRVAVIYRRLIVHAAGRALALTEWPTGPAGGRFLGPQGMALATFHIYPDRTSLTFARGVDIDPFTRMALLGAVLSYDS